jgi:ABC-type transporter Mla subunit MlaD
MPTRPSRAAAAPRKKKSAPRVRRVTPAAPPAAATPADERSLEVVARLAATCESLREALAEVPRPADFQPLADHLYEIAQHTPALLKTMEKLPELASHLSEALLRMPRPEEYEPLAQPLREFARVAPALAESLSALPRLSAVLQAASERLDRVSERIDGNAMPARSAAPPLAIARLHDAAAELDDVRGGLLAAMGTLPREEDYAATARQLRELASVSPSLLEWLKEVPKLRAPLVDSVGALRESVERVAAARAAVQAAIEELKSA